MAPSDTVAVTMQAASSPDGAARESYTRVGALSLYVRQWAAPSRRPSIMLVHGLASNSRLWDGAAEALAGRGYHVVAVDQRGHGRSDKPDDGYDMATVAADLAGLITGLGLERPVVAGQSWGGNVVVELALRRPDLVRGVCGVDGGTIQLRDRFADWESCARALAPPDLAGTSAAKFESMIRGAYRGWPEAAVRGTLANIEVLDDGTIRPWLTFERHMKVLRSLWDHRPLDGLASLSRPLLLTPASPTEPVAASQRESLARVASQSPHVRVHWFAPAHHDVHAQYPERWAEVLDAHITGGFLA
jgi:pimeloyl-ACP methyl ester carboxylesterase